jgi:hypothetical protein
VPAIPASAPLQFSGVLQSAFVKQALFNVPVKQAVFSMPPSPWTQ